MAARLSTSPVYTLLSSIYQPSPHPRPPPTILILPHQTSPQLSLRPTPAQMASYAGCCLTKLHSDTAHCFGHVAKHRLYKWRACESGGVYEAICQSPATQCEGEGKVPGGTDEGGTRHSVMEIRHSVLEIRSLSGKSRGMMCTSLSSGCKSRITQSQSHILWTIPQHVLTLLTNQRHQNVGIESQSMLLGSMSAVPGSQSSLNDPVT